METTDLRNELAKNINFEGCLYREMAFRCKQDYQIGSIYELGQCWSSGGDYVSDSCFGKYRYFFSCENGKGYKIDYEELDEKTAWELGIDLDTCEGEQEVLVSSEQKFKILSISTDEDFEEMGVYMVEVEML